MGCIFTWRIQRYIGDGEARDSLKQQKQLDANRGKKRIRTEKYGRMDLWTKIKISQFNSIVGRDGVSFRLHANESIFILDAVFDEY